MKKILFVTQFNCQGAERMTLLYAKILHNIGYKCELVQYGRKDEDKTNMLKDFIPDWMDTQEIFYAKYLQLIPILYRFIKEKKYDYVFCSHPTTGALLGLINHFCCCTKFKLVIRFSNNPDPSIKKDHLIRKMFLQYSDVIISQTEEMKKSICIHYPQLRKKIQVIHNPIDKELIDEKLSEPLHIDTSYVTFIGVGKVIPRKGFDVLLKAFALLKEKIPQSRLYIIGDFRDKPCLEYKKTLDNLTMSLGISNSVFFEGFQSNPFKYIKKANVFVLSSRDEGLPNVILESWYIGKPVVATKCIPYIEQVIEEGVNGFAVPVDNEKQMASAMIKAIDLNPKYIQKDCNQNEEKIIYLFNRLLLQ